MMYRNESSPAPNDLKAATANDVIEVNEPVLSLDGSRVVTANYAIEITDITQHAPVAESNDLDVQQTYAVGRRKSDEGDSVESQQEWWRGIASFYVVTAGVGVASQLTLRQAFPSVVVERKLREEVTLVQEDLRAYQDAAGIMDALSLGSDRLQERTAELKNEISQAEERYPSGFAHEVQSAVSAYAVPVIALIALAVKTTTTYRSYRSR